MSNLNKLAWSHVDWKKVESRVFRMQRRIYKAKNKNKIDTVHYLQNKLLHSLDAKLLSIRKVSRVPENISLLHKLTLKLSGTRNTKPVSNLKTNLVNHSVVLEKSKKTLIKLALEPEWEAAFSKNCCGERPGYTYQDAILNILETLESKPKYILSLDLSESFTELNSEILLEKVTTIKPVKRYIKYWLQNTLMNYFIQKSKNTNEFQANEINKTESLVPLLWNVALQGLETHLINWTSTKSNRCTGQTVPELGYIQYVDKILIIHSDKKALEVVEKIALDWLVKNGIKYSQDQIYLIKTTIFHYT